MEGEGSAASDEGRGDSHNHRARQNGKSQRAGVGREALAAFAIIVIVVAIVGYYAFAAPQAGTGSTTTIQGSPNVTAIVKTTTIPQSSGSNTVSNISNSTSYSGCSSIYSCPGIMMQSQGTLSFQLQKRAAGDLYDIALQCSAAPNYSSQEWYTLSSDGVASPEVNAGTTLSGNQTLNVTGLQCFNQDGTAFSGGTGKGFTGSIWMRYSTTPNGENQTVTMLTAVDVTVS